MFLEEEFSVFDFASCISDAIDLVSPKLYNHHKKVAYFSLFEYSKIQFKVWHTCHRKQPLKALC